MTKAEQREKKGIRRAHTVKDSTEWATIKLFMLYFGAIILFVIYTLVKEHIKKDTERNKFRTQILPFTLIDNSDISEEAAEFLKKPTPRDTTFRYYNEDMERWDSSRVLLSGKPYKKPIYMPGLSPLVYPYKSI